MCTKTAGVQALHKNEGLKAIILDDVASILDRHHVPQKSLLTSDGQPNSADKL